MAALPYSNCCIAVGGTPRCAVLTMILTAALPQTISDCPVEFVLVVVQRTCIPTIVSGTLVTRSTYDADSSKGGTTAAPQGVTLLGIPPSSEVLPTRELGEADPKTLAGGGPWVSKGARGARIRGILAGKDFSLSFITVGGGRFGI